MDLTEVQRQVGFEFKKQELLREALTHSSCLKEESMGLMKDNEALAWLGDALIRWVASEKVFSSEVSTEELHNRRERYVKKESLARFSVKYGLDKALILPGHQENIGGRTNQTNLHTVFEAVVGAIYIDKGYAQTKEFMLETFARM